MGRAPAVLHTHSAGFTVIAILVSLLWFRVNNVPLLPVGLLGGILLAFWSHDIDVHVGRPSLFVPTVAVCILATAIGFFVR